jgi:hypothetical protein
MIANLKRSFAGFDDSRIRMVLRRQAAVARALRPWEDFATL